MTNPLFNPGHQPNPTMRIIVDGETWMDGDLGQWEQKKPEQFVKAIQNPRNTPPGLRELMMAMADAAMRGNSVTITLQHTDTSWTLTVEH